MNKIVQNPRSMAILEIVFNKALPLNKRIEKIIALTIKKHNNNKI
ncbi:hypothetical protein [Macrococcus equi]